MKPLWRCALMLVLASSGFSATAAELWGQSKPAPPMKRPPVVKSIPVPAVRTFPGPQTQLLSPDGRFSVTSQGPGNMQGNSAGARFLRLSDLRSGEDGLLFRYMRNVEVGWAPDSRALFINDNREKNESRAYVFFPGDARKVLNLGKKILDAYPDDLKFAKADYAYIRAVRWLSATELLAALTGHEQKAGQPVAFTVCYIVDVTRTMRRTAEYDREGHHCPQQ
ncbi:MAG: hypothetical protein ABSD88_06890 [Candidatus Korobacteraceae bacterium]